MLITKKQLCKLFYDYTNMIYMECGRKLTHPQKMTLKNRIEKIAKRYTLKEQLKAKLCKKAKS